METVNQDNNGLDSDHHVGNEARTGNVSNPTQANPSKAFIGGLSPTTTEDDLKSYFSQFGSISEYCVMREKVSNRSRGFGFLTFSDAESLDKALECPKHNLNGKIVEVKRAIPRGEVKTKARKLFVGGVPATCTTEMLQAYFEQFGAVAEAQIMKDRNRQNKSRGFGFITYEDDETVNKVLAITDHKLDGKLVEVKKAEPKRPVDIPPLPLAPNAAMPTHLSPNQSPKGSVVGPYNMMTHYYPIQPFNFGGEYFGQAFPTAPGYADAPSGPFFYSPYSSPRGSFAAPLESDLPPDFAELSMGVRRFSHDYMSGAPTGMYGPLSSHPLSPTSAIPPITTPQYQFGGAYGYPYSSSGSQLSPIHPPSSNTLQQAAAAAALPTDSVAALSISSSPYHPAGANGQAYASSASISNDIHKSDTSSSRGGSTTSTSSTRHTASTTTNPSSNTTSNSGSPTTSPSASSASIIDAHQSHRQDPSITAAASHTTTTPSQPKNLISEQRIPHSATPPPSLKSDTRIPMTAADDSVVNKA